LTYIADSLRQLADAIALEPSHNGYLDVERIVAAGWWISCWVVDLHCRGESSPPQSSEAVLLNEIAQRLSSLRESLAALAPRSLRATTGSIWGQMPETTEPHPWIGCQVRVVKPFLSEPEPPRIAAECPEIGTVGTMVRYGASTRVYKCSAPLREKFLWVEFDLPLLCVNGLEVRVHGGDRSKIVVPFLEDEVCLV
ncbi:MAG: hypothetical protein KKA73_11330, partial [Chloroflexi bacterium]|nr:hypothetical protein [Chloroflexota bacterium]